MVYGYCRVSGLTQATTGTSLESQERTLREHGCDEVYSEAYTGMKADRPEFQKILSKIKKGDTLMVCKMDRLSRSVTEGVKIIQELHAKGVVVEILNMGRVDFSPMGKLMVTMLLAFSEFEHDNIIERLAEGKATAKAHGKRVDGRKEKKPEEFEDYYTRVEKGEISVVKACSELKIGRTTWYKLSKAI